MALPSNNFLLVVFSRRRAQTCACIIFARDVLYVPEMYCMCRTGGWISQSIQLLIMIWSRLNFQLLPQAFNDWHLQRYEHFADHRQHDVLFIWTEALPPTIYQ
jgi:hypothetical protein